MGKRNKTIKKVDFSSTQYEELDIIIPVYSNFEQLEKTLLAIQHSDFPYKYKITLVDDCSPDYLTIGKEFYSKLPSEINVLRHVKNQGFPKTVNYGASRSNAPFMMILNSDVVLEPHSLRVMFEHLKGSPEVAMIVPKLLFFPNSNHPGRPAGKVQHAGIVFDIRGNPYHRYVGWDSDHPFVNKVANLNAATGACMLIRRVVWKEFGGFDERFGRGVGEDISLCLDMRLKGYTIRYLPQAVGFHYTGMSAERTNSAFPVQENMQKFRDKYQNKIPYDEFLLTGLG